MAIVQKHMDDNWRSAMIYLERKHADLRGRRARLRVDVNPKDELQELLALSGDDLDATIEIGHVELTSLILSRDPDLNIRDTEGVAVIGLARTSDHQHVKLNLVLLPRHTCGQT